MAKPAPISNAVFTAKATDLPVTIGETSLLAKPRTFSTGSVGFMAAGKSTVLIDGIAVPVQVSMTITVIGSKNGANAA